MIREGDSFPSVFLMRPDGTNLDLSELRKKEHALLLFIDKPDRDILAFIQRFQDEVKIFDWLKTRLLPIFPEASLIPTPWPAPSFPPFAHKHPPEGAEWGKGYLVSLNRTVYSLYPELPMLSAHRVEQDVLHWEAGHCMQ